MASDAVIKAVAIAHAKNRKVFADDDSPETVDYDEARRFYVMMEAYFKPEIKVQCSDAIFRPTEKFHRPKDCQLPPAKHPGNCGRIGGNYCCATCIPDLRMKKSNAG